MTREEKRKRRARRWAWAACIGIIAICAAMLMCCTTNAANTASEAQALDPLTKALAVIGTGWVTTMLMRFVEWLDAPGKKVRG